MKINADGLCTLDSGRTFYPDGGVIGLGSHGKIYGGGFWIRPDGAIAGNVHLRPGDEGEFTKAERKEIAEHMIMLWRLVAEGG